MILLNIDAIMISVGVMQLQRDSNDIELAVFVFLNKLVLVQQY